MMPLNYDAERHRLSTVISSLSLVLRSAALWLATVTLMITGCVYRIDIQQGNLLEPDKIEQVQVGMTRSQVQFLLGTPMTADSFHRNRWDYTYYLREGRSRDIQRRWLVVYFDDDNRVVRLDRELELDPVG
jgi:outer membrane protein assembly factor BamE